MYDHGSTGEKPGLLEAEGIDLIKWGMRLFANKLARTLRKGFSLDVVVEEHGVSSNTEEPRAAAALGSNTKIPVKCCKALRAGSSKKVTWSTAQLMWLYTDEYSMDNKQELGATLQLERSNQQHGNLVA